MPVMACPKCGYVIVDPARPCPSCGILLSEQKQNSSKATIIGNAGPSSISITSDENLQKPSTSFNKNEISTGQPTRSPVRSSEAIGQGFAGLVKLASKIY
jgi:RNA polymerase subunit RPABC4/transcription elongation factor Spt4